MRGAPRWSFIAGLMRLLDAWPSGPLNGSCPPGMLRPVLSSSHYYAPPCPRIPNVVALRNVSKLTSRVVERELHFNEATGLPPEKAYPRKPPTFDRHLRVCAGPTFRVIGCVDHASVGPPSTSDPIPRLLLRRMGGRLGGW